MMMAATEYGDEAVVVTLHGLGADVNAADNVSRSVLDRGSKSCFCVERERERELSLGHFF